jgi:hypothetical protein
VRGVNPDQLSTSGIVPLRQDDAADQSSLGISTLNIQRLFAEHPDLANKRVEMTASINKLARDNRRLVIHDESYDLDMKLHHLRRHDLICRT